MRYTGRTVAAMTLRHPAQSTQPPRRNPCSTSRNCHLSRSALSADFLMMISPKIHLSGNMPFRLASVRLNKSSRHCSPPRNRRLPTHRKTTIIIACLRCSPLLVIDYRGSHYQRSPGSAAPRPTTSQLSQALLHLYPGRIWSMSVSCLDHFLHRKYPSVRFHTSHPQAQPIFRTCLLQLPSYRHGGIHSNQTYPIYHRTTRFHLIRRRWLRALPLVTRHPQTRYVRFRRKWPILPVVRSLPFPFPWAPSNVTIPDARLRHSKLNTC